MDLTTILTGAPAPSGPAGTGDPATSATVAGDLAALFASLLQAATVPAAPVAAEGTGADGDADATGTATAPVTAGQETGVPSWPLALAGAEASAAAVAVPADGLTAVASDLAGADQSSTGTAAPSAVPGGEPPAPGVAGGPGAEQAQSVPAAGPRPEPAGPPTGEGRLDAAQSTTVPTQTAEPTTRDASAPRTATQPVAVSAPVPGEGAVAAPDLAAGRAAPSPSGATPGATPGVAPAVVDRVMEAVEALENAPPPRRIRVEVGDLRVSVSLRHDGIHVTVDGNTQPTPTWDADLVAALEARGLSLAGSGAHEEENGHRRQTPEQDTPPEAPAARPDASRQGDDALRL